MLLIKYLIPSPTELLLLVHYMIRHWHTFEEGGTYYHHQHRDRLCHWVIDYPTMDIIFDIRRYILLTIVIDSLLQSQSS